MYTKGFIALFSVIIVSALLLGLLSVGGLAGFFSRTDALDREYKQASKTLAEGCVDAALLQVANDYTFSRSVGSLQVGQDLCNQVSVQTLNSNSTQKLILIDVSANAHTAFTHLVVTAKVQNPAVATNLLPITVSSWQETP